MSFLLTFIAGFSTMLGTFLIFFKIKKINKFIASSLAFASGVMFIISIFDLIPESLKLIKTNNSFFTIIMSFFFIFLGILISMIINYFLPEEKIYKDNKLYKVGLISMVAIVLHNIPEGIATFIAGNNNTSLAIDLTIAIALHNIPEGISIAVPIYYSTKSKSKALLYTLISSISEPFGALLAFLFLKNFINDTILGILFAIIAGIMLNISLCELLPTSKKYDYKKLTIIFFIVGIIFMALFCL